jgi:hypothetical protein
MYAFDNQDQFPTNFDVLAPYFGGNANPEMTNLNHYEMVYQGSLTNIKAPMSTIVVREKEATFLNGKWVKAYGFADGHSELKSDPPEGFDTWERERMITQPAGQ